MYSQKLFQFARVVSQSSASYRSLPLSGSALGSSPRFFSKSAPIRTPVIEPAAPQASQKGFGFPFTIGFLTGITGAFGALFLMNKEETPSVASSSAIVREATKRAAEHKKIVPLESLPIIEDTSQFLAMAPDVPPPIKRDTPARLIVDLQSTVKTSKLSLSEDYEFWTFNDSVPGPFIRCRVGDVLEVRHKNIDFNGIGHNIDFHAVTVCFYF